MQCASPTGVWHVATGWHGGSHIDELLADGRTVLLEKDVNLDIGLRLDAWLRARGGRTLLTRTQDLAGGDRPYTTEGADLKATLARLCGRPCTN